MGLVVLGAGGRLGRLIRDRMPVAARWLTRADADVLDVGALTAVLAPGDCVMCLAGVTPAGSGDMQDNVRIAAAVLDAAAAARAGRVFLFSTAAVYGALPGPLTEDGPIAPLSPYGQAKVDMEHVAATHAHPSTVLRLGNVAGADAILGGWRSGFQLDVLADGTTPRRSYIGPGALARVLATLAQTPDVPPLMNLAAPGAVAMGDLLDAAGLAWTARPATGNTLANVTLDTTLLCRFTQMKPDDSTAQGIVADWQKGVPA
ncbi:NAD(P)-dependent oxidoreductase [uncultured Tateyamaria sp.]|uniref:NAD-dependent epimerase/dehydratase family protein n=1 Tax=uncultured Tateyamaria sp. TaxID=455651 RepID=UPI002623333D|nr:NAD(P)-dependent oxidoreductase [uncultured Tateyamaria sp.]